MPTVETVFVAEVFPPPQLKVAPVVLDVAVRLSLKLVQVRTAGAAIAALGATMFWITETDAEAVQPFDGSVTVTA